MITNRKTKRHKLARIPSTLLPSHELDDDAQMAELSDIINRCRSRRRVKRIRREW